MRAETIAKALNGHKSGDGWVARCPAHHDHTPSLSISDGREGRVLVHCFAGCDQGQVIATLKARGLWDRANRFDRRTITRNFNHDTKKLPKPNNAKREYALDIWREAVSAGGTLVETYLHSRGLKIVVPAVLRFHPKLKHYPSRTVWPAMVALVTREPETIPLAIHRTFIARDGQGKAPVDPEKMVLGPCKGGAVRLSEPADVLMVGEGIETCLAAMQATGFAAWAALSTSGMCSLQLPHIVREIIVLADGDPPGEAAARHAALRWLQEGRRVRIARPPQGLDFNDLLLSSARPSVEGAA